MSYIAKKNKSMSFTKCYAWKKLNYKFRNLKSSKKNNKTTHIH